MLGKLETIPLVISVLRASGSARGLLVRRAWLRDLCEFVFLYEDSAENWELFHAMIGMSCLGLCVILLTFWYSKLY